MNTRIFGFHGAVILVAKDRTSIPPRISPVSAHGLVGELSGRSLYGAVRLLGLKLQDAWEGHQTYQSSK